MAYMTHNEHEQQLTLVVGGTGKTGRRVMQKLAQRQIPTRLGSRSAQPAMDWDDRSTWAPALDGVSAAYITYYPDLCVPGAVDTVGDFATQAARSGVRRLVFLSGRGEPEAQAAEKLVQEASPEATIVRASWFNQNFSEGELLGAVAAGTIALPVAGNVREPFIDADDIADVAVAALTDARHAGEIYDVTGPRLLSFHEVAREMADAAGRPVDFQTISLADYQAMLTEYEVPAEAVTLLTYLLTEVLGNNDYLSDGVQRALGREPRDFRDFARNAAASGVWNAPVPA